MLLSYDRMIKLKGLDEKWNWNVILKLKVDKFLKVRIVSGEFIFSLQMFTLQIVDKSTSYTFKIVN